ncbi:MAG: V-type ATP synthase subunit E [Ruminococcus sp.]|nr:V-type ATP synthase subunit E [Ruminococcus sp.]
MSGIDKIIEQIELDSRHVCDSVTDEARRKADAILSQAQQKAQDIVDEGKAQTAARVENIKKRGDSAADLEEKRILLNTKQRIISEMLRTGLSEAKALPDNEYFDLIAGMVEKASMPQDGVIRFGQKDLGRMPADFMGRLNSVCKGTLVLAKDAADIDAGFILVYGGIEQNCSFDAIFTGEREELSDRAGKLLFG